jgi:N-formylglutamate deformylase
VAGVAGKRRVTPFLLRPPATAAIPLIVSIPHTGTVLPAEIAAELASDEMRRQPMTDWHLDSLYEFLPELGVTSLVAVYSRFVVDLNRAPQPQALYPGRFETGLVPERTFQGETIHARRPDAAAIEARKREYHAPYHARLLALVDEMRARFGRVVLVDAHSVASKASLLHGELVEDIFLGNRDGATCSDWLMDLLERSFAGHGLRVSRNHPYKGGYITDHYGRLPDVEAVQIEMCQRVYMAEDAPESALAQPRFGRARALLRDVFAGLCAAIKGRLG